MLHNLKLRPVIEFMGNPSGMFTSLKGDNLQDMWIELVTRFLHRYIGEFDPIVIKMQEYS